MKRTLMTWLACAGIALGIILGCSTPVDVGAGSGSNDNTSTGGSTIVDPGGDFSEDPPSPGGTGGTDGEPGEGPGGEDQGPVDLPSEETRSFFTAFQVDPVEEDTAGAKFVVAGDVDQDGLTDLVSAWNQSQPVQLHLQRRDPAGNISFRSITLAGTSPIAIVAGIELGMINGDDFPDVVVLVKATGFTTLCPSCEGNADLSGGGPLDGQIIILFNPGDASLIPDGDRWDEVALINPFVSLRSINNHFPGFLAGEIDDAITKPEESGFTGLAVGNIDGLPGDDIVVALNPTECETLGQKPAINTVDILLNPGPDLAQIPASWGITTTIGSASGPVTVRAPLTVMRDLPQVKDVEIYDIDGDTDLDVVATFTTAMSRNVRWARNPLVESGAVAVISGANDGIGDVCIGGFNDGLSCTTDPEICLGAPGTEDDGCCSPTDWRFVSNTWENRPVGQVDTGADIISVGDADSDGFLDVAVRSTVGGVVQWFRRPNTLTLPPEFPPGGPNPDRQDFPWTVYTFTEVTDQEIQAIALGDVTGDGQNELLAAVDGGVFWFDATVGTTVYDPWFGNTIIQDSPDADAGTSQQDNTGGGTDPDDPDAPTIPDVPGGTGVGVGAVDTSTWINDLIVVDLDGDGKNDVVGTLDRRAGSGLSDDRIVWYRNTRTDDDDAPAPRPVPQQ